MTAYNKNDVEQLFFAASYSDEIERRKLASQMVLTLGGECSKEKIVHILSGNYLGVTVCREQLEHETIECNTFYVMERKERILVVVSDRIGDKAEVYADYGSSDGVLAIGKEVSRTMDSTVYELDTANAERVHIIVYMYPVEYEAEHVAEANVLI